jgi:hypothetical protein
MLQKLRPVLESPYFTLLALQLMISTKQQTDD